MLTTVSITPAQPCARQDVLLPEARPHEREPGGVPYHSRPPQARQDAFLPWGTLRSFSKPERSPGKVRVLMRTGLGVK